jgi:hypothetical protein
MTSEHATRMVLALHELPWGSVILQTQNGWAAPPPKDRHALLPKVKGRREGVEVAVVDEVVGDDTTEQQEGEVACTNVVCVVVDIGNPPSIG